MDKAANIEADANKDVSKNRDSKQSDEKKKVSTCTEADTVGREVGMGLCQFTQADNYHPINCNPP